MKEMTRKKFQKRKKILKKMAIIKKRRFRKKEAESIRRPQNNHQLSKKQLTRKRSCVRRIKLAHTT